MERQHAAAAGDPSHQGTRPGAAGDAHHPPPPEPSEPQSSGPPSSAEPLSAEPAGLPSSAGPPSAEPPSAGPPPPPEPAGLPSSAGPPSSEPHAPDAPPPHQPPSDPFDPAESLRILGPDAVRVRSRMEPDGRYLFFVWGVAWIVGYLALWSTARDDSVPAGWAFVVFTGMLIAAVVLTAVHIARRTAGVRGASAVSGAMYGWAWTLSFVMLGVLLTAMGRLGASEAMIGLLSNGISCLIVGALYMAGAAIWREWSMFALGVWIVVVGAVATLVGLPTTFLVMALAGGGGMLAGALATHLALRRATASR